MKLDPFLLNCLKFGGRAGCPLIIGLVALSTAPPVHIKVLDVVELHKILWENLSFNPHSEPKSHQFFFGPNIPPKFLKLC